MSRTADNTNKPSGALGAGALTQLLAAVACFLGAFVLPYEFPELRGLSRTVLIVLGIAMLAVGVGNILFGRRMNRILTRAGRRSRVVVPREGIGYLAIMLTLAVGALLGQRNMPLLVFGMMAGPFILNGWIVYSMLRGISVRRSSPGRAAVGEFVAVEMTIRNSKRLLASHLVEVRDLISPATNLHSDQDAEASVTFIRVPPGQSRTGRYQIRFPRRGKYTFGPARVSSRFPLGIGERGQIFTETTSVIVHPEIGFLVPAWKQRQKEMAEASRSLRSRPGLFDDEFHRMREYRPDDNPRAIHWRSSARRGELIVREFQPNRKADSFVLLDLPDLPEWSASDSETAISLAATICVEQTRSASGGRFLLAISARTPVIVSSRFPGGFREEALDALAECHPDARADLTALLRTVIESCDISHERLLLITPRVNLAHEALQELSRNDLFEDRDFARTTTILEATAEKLGEAIRFDTPREPPQSRQSSQEALV